MSPMARTCFGCSMFHVVRQTEHPTLSGLPTPCHHKVSHTGSTRPSKNGPAVQGSVTTHSRAILTSENAPCKGRQSSAYAFVDPFFHAFNHHCTSPDFSVLRVPTRHKFTFFCEPYANQKHGCKMLATSSSSTAAIPEPTNSCCITPFKVHLVLPFSTKPLFPFSAQASALYCAQG